MPPLGEDTEENMNLTVDFTKDIGRIKPMNGVGQPPFFNMDTRYFDFLSDANIPYSRLHDVNGLFGGYVYVDIPNIFRDFDADVNDPASYDFAFTDVLVKGLIEHHCEPVYRLGVTIENHSRVKAYRIYPPKDFQKWAEICEHIVRHYNEGWADGFHFDIKYWEIWNEPDNHYNVCDNNMWLGTPEEYYDLYRTTSRHLRKCFGNSIKIGGYASCGFYYINLELPKGNEAFGTTDERGDWIKLARYFVDFFDGFIKIVSEEHLPFDFFSHHSYGSVEEDLNMQAYAEKRLEEAGLGDVEIHLNEWNTAPRSEERGTSKASAEAAALMCAMQDTKMEMMCYYDARIGVSVYGGLFNPLTFEPFCTYYSFKAFGKLLKMGRQVECIKDGADGIYATAAANPDKSEKGVLIANIGEKQTVRTNLSGMTVYAIDEAHFFTPTELDPSELIMEKYQTYYIG